MGLVSSFFVYIRRGRSRGWWVPSHPFILLLFFCYLTVRMMWLLGLSDITPWLVASRKEINPMHIQLYTYCASVSDIYSINIRYSWLGSVDNAYSLLSCASGSLSLVSIFSVSLHDLSSLNLGLLLWNKPRVKTMRFRARTCLAGLFSVSGSASSRGGSGFSRGALPNVS